MRFLKCWVLATALSLGAVAVYAGPYEDGLDAYRRGDHSAAAKLFRQAADTGNAEAQYFLGSLYGGGTGVPKDDQQAGAWFRKAAEQGHAAAQFFLGLMYDNGSPVLKDDQLGARWYADAEHAFGERGKIRGVLKDGQQALVWYRKSAEQGHALAQHNLGVIYANGTSVPMDDQVAYFWFLLSSAQGDGSAARNRDLVESRLTPDQRAAVQAQARDWKPRKQ